MSEEAFKNILRSICYAIVIVFGVGLMIITILAFYHATNYMLE